VSQTSARAPERPIPQPDDATQAYWDAAQRGEFVMQQCAACAHRRFPPRPMCPRCQSLECAWRAIPGRGRVYSFVVCHPPLLPAFMERAPFAVVLVALDDDPSIRIVGNLLGRDGRPDPGPIEIGAPVEVCFEVVTPDVTLPQWRRSSGMG
jgi:uncharacterized OB-fold protein